jgi:hypothetical protein
MNFDELKESVNSSSAEAFALARDAAESGDFDKDQDRAKVLNDQLTEFWEQIESLAADQQAELTQAWSDARLDIGYLLSRGELDTSTRLYQIVRDR